MTVHRYLILAAIGAVLVAAPWPDVGAQPHHGPMWGQDRWDPGAMHRDRWHPNHMGRGQRHRMFRHWTFMNQGVPQEYSGARNPFSFSAETVAAGAEVYADNCAACHGDRGFGDGEAGRDLSPSPALLSYLVQMPMAVDEYLLWAISDGGDAFGTDMPAFKDTLTEDEIWKVITWMRAGFPETAENE